MCPVGESVAQASAPGHKHYDDSKAAAAPVAPGRPLAPRLQNLGGHVFPSSTKVARAQLFMNQGLNLAFGFNHAEAKRSFAEAARLDPSLAMAYWGQALVMGPNINAPMVPEAEPVAVALVQKAVALKGRATVRERAYIGALATRYTGKTEDRAQADRAYAEAMLAVTRAYPNDLDARTLHAEALMDLRPWNYWTRDGKPYDETRQLQASLERVLKGNRNHPGALHLWIHLWESTNTPERAEAEADRLLPLMPGAGHMVHMAAHIYQRVGRHAELAELKKLVGDPSLNGQTTFSANTGVAILGIAPEVVAGEIAAKRGDWDQAILHLDRAVRFEDSLIYQEMVHVATTAWRLRRV